MKLPVKFRRSSLLTKVVVLLILVCATVTLVSQRAQIRASQSQYQQLSGQAAELQQKNQELQQDIGSLGTDDSVRKIAREALGLVENGEIIFSDTGE